MEHNKEIIKKFNSLDYSEKINFLTNFEGDLDLDFTNFLTELSISRVHDDTLRIEAIKVIGLYKGQYNDREIVNKLFSLVFSKDEDDEIKVYALNTLSFLEVGDNEIDLSKKIIKSDEYILVKEAAFSLISKHKELPSARDALYSIRDDEIFGKSAQRELN